MLSFDSRNLHTLGVRASRGLFAGTLTLAWLVAGLTAAAQEKKPPAKPPDNPAPEKKPPAKPPEDPVAALEAARAEHTKALEDAQKKLLEAVEARLKNAQGQGDLPALEKLQAIKKSLEADNKLPEGVKDSNVLSAARSRDRAVDVANLKLQAAYDKAVRELTKAGKVEEAKAMQKEKDAFMGSKPGADENAGQYFLLGGRNPLPGFFQPSAGAFNTPEGLRCREGAVVFTRDGNFLKKDFTMDLVYSLDNTPGRNKIMLFGIGEPVGNGPNRDPNGAYMRIHPIDLGDGELLLTGPKGTVSGLGHVKNKGTHLARMEKKGDVVTFSICMNYDGKFTADFTQSITSLKELVPGLTEKTTRLFFGHGGAFKQVRLTVAK